MGRRAAYTAEKKDLKDKVTDRKKLLAMLQDGEAAFSGKDYGQAKKLYTQIRQEASYQEFYALALQRRITRRLWSSMRRHPSF